MPRPHLTPGKDPVLIVQEARWASGPVGTGAENLAPPGFDPRTVKLLGSRYTDYANRPTQTGLTFTNSTFCPLSVFMCLIWISEQTVTISLYSIN
jgi:hypothetical protein